MCARCLPSVFSQVWCEVFLRDDGAPLSLDHYNGIYIGLEKLKIVSAVLSCCAAACSCSCPVPEDSSVSHPQEVL